MSAIELSPLSKVWAQIARGHLAEAKATLLREPRDSATANESQCLMQICDLNVLSKELCHNVYTTLNVHLPCVCQLEVFADVCLVNSDPFKAKHALSWAIRIDPKKIALHCKLALTFKILGQFQDSIASYRAALNIDAYSLAALKGLAQYLTPTSNAIELREIYIRILEIDRDDALANEGLATLDYSIGKWRQALKHIDSIRLSDRNPRVVFLRGIIFLRFLRRTTLGIQQMRHAAKSAVSEPKWDLTIAMTFARYRMFHLAESSIDNVLKTNINNPQAWVIRATLTHRQGQTQLALALLDTGLLHCANATGAGRIRFTRAFVHLSQAKFSSAWQDYEWREMVGSIVRVDPWPVWSGATLTEKTILVVGEQGIGDEILFSSMFSDVAAHAKRVVVKCSPRLAPIFRRSFPNIEFISYGTYIKPKDQDADFQIRAGSLPLHFRGNLAAFPQRRSYLQSDRSQCAEVRKRYCSRAGGRLIVGISWSTQQTNVMMPKAPTAAIWRTILSIPDCYFVNVQYGDARSELSFTAFDLGIELYEDPSVNSLMSLDAHANQLDAIDVLVTVSNTTMHLGCALGKDVLVLAPLSPQLIWCYPQESDKTPWYPNATVFRENERGWLEAVQQLATDLLKRSIRCRQARLRAESQSM